MRGPQASSIMNALLRGDAGSKLSGLFIKMIDNPFWTVTLPEMLDVVFVAILLYTAIVWAQQTRAAFVVRGILILGSIYIIAKYLDLQMTAWIFQGFFAIFLIMIVVIFQEELRQLFERIAVWSLARKRTPTLGSSTSDVLVRTVADLAKEHVGALIVIRGNDPLERHITGGIPLDGKVSAPLLKSIFDPHSPGHDGAVLVDQDNISRFAAHLPLSKDLRQLANVGTRHSAALGLAELTDALCIVVSEERGTISVATRGQASRSTEHTRAWRRSRKLFAIEVSIIDGKQFRLAAFSRELDRQSHRHRAGNWVLVHLRARF